MSSPIRVLHIVTHMERGGLETLLMNYYRAIDRSKLQFDFLVHRPTQAAYDAEILSAGGNIFRLPALNPFSPAYRRALDTFFREHSDYRIVHCHLDCMSAIPLKYAKKHGIPVRIAHAHNSSQDKDLKYLLKLLWKRAIPAYATDLFACGKLAGDWFFGDRAYTILNNAIDVHSFSFRQEVRDRVRNALQIDDALVVGHVGRFCAVKNHTFILDVFSDLLKICPKANLLLIGDGPLRAAMEQKAADLGIAQNIAFLGLRADIPDLLQAMDVFIFPSLYEGLPVSLIEAQAAGLPCVVSDRISTECVQTPLVRQLPLDCDPDLWPTAVRQAAQTTRSDTAVLLSEAGFDVHQNAHWLLDHYTNKLIHDEEG